MSQDYTLLLLQESFVRVHDVHGAYHLINYVLVPCESLVTIEVGEGLLSSEVQGK